MAGEVLPSSEELIARCARGDSEALRLLYDRTSAQLYGVLRRILVREDLAQEALQEVFVSIWRKADGYRPSRGAAFTWMVSIARYRALDIKRSRKYEVNVGDMVGDFPADHEALSSDLLATADHDSEVKRLMDCVMELSLMQRNAVSLAYLAGLTHSEAAEKLGAPIGTVKSWVRRGLASLKGCLQA